jgi:hypothetical protein
VIADLGRRDVRLIGDYQDLLPAESSLDGVDPASTNDADLLTAAVAGVVGLARAHTDLRKEHDALLAAQAEQPDEPG